MNLVSTVQMMTEGTMAKLQSSMKWKKLSIKEKKQYQVTFAE
jgi:hypothetical protein